MNYKFCELLQFRISIKSYENTNKVGPTHLFQIASCLVFLLFQRFGMLQVYENQISLRKWFGGTAQLRIF